MYLSDPLFTGHNAGGNPLRYAAAQINHNSINSIVLHDWLCTGASTPYHEKKITFEFQTIDSQLTARGAGDDAIGRKLDNAADAFTNKLFFSAFTRPCLLKFFTEKWVCITWKKKYAADVSIRRGELTGDASG